MNRSHESHLRIGFHINEEAGTRAGLQFAPGLVRAADDIYRKGCGQ